MSDGEKLLRHILEPYKGKLVLLDVWELGVPRARWLLPIGRKSSNAGAIRCGISLHGKQQSQSWKNLIKLNNLVGDNIAHYNLPAAQQSAIENYLNIRSFPSYRLFDKEGNRENAPKPTPPA